MPVDVRKTVSVACNFSRQHFDANPNPEELETFVREVLFEPRELLKAEELGLVTKAEVAAALADRVYVWMLDRAGIPIGGVSAPIEQLVTELQKAIYS